MGREIRKVPKNWEHPRDGAGRHIPMFDGRDYHKRARNWLDECAKWERGERPDYAGSDTSAYFWEWDGPPPERERHMLVDVPEEERTCFMLYETTSEGTPHHDSPVFETIDDLCEWAEKNATTFAHFTATKDEWMRMLSGGFVHASDPAMPGVIFT